MPKRSATSSSTLGKFQEHQPKRQKNDNKDSEENFEITALRRKLSKRLEDGDKEKEILSEDTDDDDYGDDRDGEHGLNDIEDEEMEKGEGTMGDVEESDIEEEIDLDEYEDSDDPDEEQEDYEEGEEGEGERSAEEKEETEEGWEGNYDIKQSKKGKEKRKDSEETHNIISNIKPLTKESLQSTKNAIEKSGVVYLSRIPPFMKPQKLRHLLSPFGAIGRIFLAPESPQSRTLRMRFGGNKKRNYEEGWVEFLNKRDAKLVAETLNATIIGGKKSSYYHDDLWNIKYLPKFKWHNLQAQIAYENASRQAKLRAEIEQATRDNRTFLRNVEKAKMVENMEKKRREKAKEKGDQAKEEIEVRRQFKQKTIKKKGVPEDGTSEKIKSEAISRVLGKIF